MGPKSPWDDIFFYSEGEDFDEACRRRLRDELGVNPAGIDVILNMRSQILEMQVRMRQMEAELAAHRSKMEHRMGQYRREIFEAYWYELSDRNGKER